MIRICGFLGVVALIESYSPPDARIDSVLARWLRLPVVEQASESEGHPIATSRAFTFERLTDRAHTGQARRLGGTAAFLGFRTSLSTGPRRTSRGSTAGLRPQCATVRASQPVTSSTKVSVIGSPSDAYSSSAPVSAL